MEPLLNHQVVGDVNQSTASKQLYHSSWRGTLKTTIFIIRGDIVRLAIDGDGKIEGYEKICSASDTSRFAGSTNSGYGKLFGVGIVEKLQNDRVRFKFENAVTTAIRGTESARIYHTDSNTVEKCSIGDMQINDRVVCRIVAARLYEVIIIRS